MKPVHPNIPVLLKFARTGNDVSLRPFLLNPLIGPNLQSKRGLTLLGEAIGQGQVQMVKDLLSAGALPDLHSDYYRGTPLLLAVTSSRYFFQKEEEGASIMGQIVEMLLQAGANPNHKQSKSPYNSALQILADAYPNSLRSQDVYPQLFTMLLDAGAQVEYKNIFNNTIFHGKVCHNPAILKNLLAHLDSSTVSLLFEKSKTQPSPWSLLSSRPILCQLMEEALVRIDRNLLENLPNSHIKNPSIRRI